MFRSGLLAVVVLALCAPVAEAKTPKLGVAKAKRAIAAQTPSGYVVFGCQRYSRVRVACWVREEADGYLWMESLAVATQRRSRVRVCLPAEDAGCEPL